MVELCTLTSWIGPALLALLAANPLAAQQMAPGSAEAWEQDHGMVTAMVGPKRKCTVDLNRYSRDRFRDWPGSLTAISP